MFGIETAVLLLKLIHDQWPLPSMGRSSVPIICVQCRPTFIVPWQLSVHGQKPWVHPTKNRAPTMKSETRRAVFNLITPLWIKRISFVVFWNNKCNVYRIQR